MEEIHMDSWTVKIDKEKDLVTIKYSDVEATTLYIDLGGIYIFSGDELIKSIVFDELDYGNDYYDDEEEE